MTPSEQLIRRGMAIEGDDTERARVLAEGWKLQRVSKLNRSKAMDDLNVAGFYHVMPCSCPKCNL